MANVLLGVTGSVAAIHTPLLFDELRKVGHAVKVVATQASLYFFDPAALEPMRTGTGLERNRTVVILDDDEWPGRAEGLRYQRSDRVLHIELRRWADVLLIAPLDANTLAKLACGLADNCLTCVYRAWDRARPVVLAPAMNTMMWENPLTVRHLRLLAEEAAAGPPESWSSAFRREPEPPEGGTPTELLVWIHEHCPALKVVSPVSKRLACDDVGMGALAERDQIVAAVAACGLAQ